MYPRGVMILQRSVSWLDSFYSGDGEIHPKEAFATTDFPWSTSLAYLYRAAEKAN